MNQRIEKLRTQSQEAQPRISMERARLLTEFYKSGKAEQVSVPVARAMAFDYILQNKKLCINEGELIVGERGPAPKATPTYPEVCTHTMQDLDILDSRDKVPFQVDPKVRKIHREEIIPFWQGRSLRDKIFRDLAEEWIAAYETGVFTEFQEQRAPGHTVLDDKIYQKGMHDFIKDIDKRLNNLDFYNDPRAYDKQEELKAMKIAAQALIKFARRYADYAQQLAENIDEPNRQKELHTIARICRRIPENKPANFWEALQYYWFVHLGVITEYNTWDSFNPGKLDQHLYPFYKKGLENGTLTRAKAKELLKAFWIKFNNQPAPPKVGVTAQESNTYTDFCLINLGGVNSRGEDAVNELSYLILDIIEEMRILQPSSMVQISKKNPDRFIKRALKIIKTGFGQPSIFNTDEIIKELLRQGKDIIDARNGGASGCVETGAFGKESYILTGYFNFAKILEIALNNGLDPETGKRIGIETGDPRDFSTFDEVLAAYKKQLNHFIDIKIKGNCLIERFWANYLPAPFLSLLIDDCIENGQDYNSGGARYNTSYIQGVGTGTLTDSLAAIRYQVFDHNNIGFHEFMQAMQNNYDGYGRLRKQLLEDTPKYGNDDDYADELLQGIFEIFYNAVEGRPNTKGGFFRINLLPTTSHIYFGSKTGATPDGRQAHLPLSEGISPVQGADKKGPTAVIKSAAKIDHVRTGGTLLNQKFTPSFFESEKAIDSIVNLIRAYFAMDGHHIQFNVVGADTLRKAQENPEEYKNLIVRVAGYSDYFVDLTEELQEEIITRTEQGHF